METQFDETLLQDLDSFIQCYQFIDDKEIYTNGSELIQVSRIKQWFAYNNNKQKRLEEENKKSKNDIKLILKENGNKEKVIKKQEEILNKAIEYIGNGNIGIPRKTREKFIKILKGE